MQSQIGIETGARGQSVADEALPANWTDLRFLADSKAQHVIPAVAGLSAERVVFNRAANWLSECIHQHESCTTLRRLSK
jgi:hypothetical protein